MGASNLIGMRIQIESLDDFECECSGEVIAAEPDGSVAVLKLDTSYYSESQSFSHAVVSVQHADRSLKELSGGTGITCGLTLVPDERFSIENPFDLTWWRGGNAFIADVVMIAAKN